MQFASSFVYNPDWCTKDRENTLDSGSGCEAALGEIAAAEVESAAEEVESATEEVESAAAGVSGGPAGVQRAVTGAGRAATVVESDVNNNNGLVTMPTSKLDEMVSTINDIKATVDSLKVKSLPDIAKPS